MSRWILRLGLAGVEGEDLVDLLAQLEQLAGVDLDVGRLALHALRPGLVDQHPAVGEHVRLPALPAASSTAAIEAAWPMQKVATSGLMYCIVS